jgi:hypothetical protein
LLRFRLNSIPKPESLPEYGEISAPSAAVARRGVSITNTSYRSIRFHGEQVSRSLTTFFSDLQLFVRQYSQLSRGRRWPAEYVCRSRNQKCVCSSYQACDVKLKNLHRSCQLFNCIGNRLRDVRFEPNHGLLTLLHSVR